MEYLVTVAFHWRLKLCQRDICCTLVLWNKFHNLVYRGVTKSLGVLYTENYDPLQFGSTDFETVAKILLEN